MSPRWLSKARRTVSDALWEAPVLAQMLQPSLGPFPSKHRDQSKSPVTPACVDKKPDSADQIQTLDPHSTLLRLHAGEGLPFRDALGVSAGVVVALETEPREAATQQVCGRQLCAPGYM